MTNYQHAFDHLDEYIEQQMRIDGTPGLALALTDRDRTLRIATYGFAELGAQRPVTPDTLFEIGSIGKSFTSIALLQLHEAGQLDLQAPVSRYLPWFSVRSAYDPITVHHLLSHTAGIIAGTDPSPSVLAQVWGLRDTEVSCQPGTCFHYSNVGYKTLGVVLERLEGSNYGAIIQSRILDPLEMENTEPAITHDIRSRLAVGYASLYDDRPEHSSQPLVPATWLETESGDGSIASTPGDMAIYLRMLLNRGQGVQRRVLADESFGLMTRPVIAMPGDTVPAFYGYGLTTATPDGTRQLGHGGGMVGYFAAIRGDLDNGLGAVVLVNGPGRPSAIAKYALSLLQAAAGGRELPPHPPIADPTKIERASDYAGLYRGDAGRLEFDVKRDQLLVRRDGQSIVEARGGDTFYVAHPDFDRFLFQFGRAQEEGDIVEVFHGDRWYTNDRYRGPATFATPADWAAYPGHYASHNPWAPNFRVVLRKDCLWLIFSNPPDGLAEDQTLVPLADGSFRVGTDETSPERLRFADVADGHALRAHLSDGVYERRVTA